MKKLLQFMMLVAILALVTSPVAIFAQGTPILDSDVTYVYPLDSGPAGPNQGDSGQPRCDANPIYCDDTGDELADGNTTITFSDVGNVGFNEFHGSFTGTDTGDPQPRIEFDLSGARTLTQVAIDYITGGAGGILGPDEVEISFSTDGGASFSATPDVVFAGFDRTNTATTIFTNVTISLTGTGVTHVRMDFLQGNFNANTPAWVFLSELTFFEAEVTDTDNDGVLDNDDVCAGTVISESIPTVRLGTNRWALLDSNFDFDTTPPKGQGPSRSYTTTDTCGCSCKQIIDAFDLGKGHEKLGCSISAMDDWVAACGATP